MHVTSLRIYPVKSLAGVTVGAASVEPWGLAGDRRWGVFDDEGNNLTARVVREMLALRAEPVDDHTIRLRDREGSAIEVETPVDGEAVPVGLSRQGSAVAAREEAHAWLSDRLGRAARLLWQPDPTARTLSEKRGGLPGETLSMADAGPLLLVSEASMARLNEWIRDDAELPDVSDIDPGDLSGTSPAGPAPLDVARFRPNVVVDGDEPFAEDGWPGVRIGDVEFRTTMHCDRCVMTTIDPVTLAGGKEPIRTLARHRRWAGKTWFGVRLVPLARGKVSVGDLAAAL